MQQQIIDKKLKFFVIDGYEVAKQTGMGGASTPSCRPASSPSAACCRARKPSPPSRHAIEKTYGKRGEAVVQKNFAAVDQALAHLHEVQVPAAGHRTFDLRPPVPAAGAGFRAEGHGAA